MKALYPSIKSRNTGEIIRKRVTDSKIKFSGFNIKKGLAYISMNTDLTTDLSEIEHILPQRKSGRSTKLKMSAVKPDWDPEEKFIFEDRTYNEIETRTS